MLLHFISFSSRLDTSNGFKFGYITGDATVDSPFNLTWYFDNGEDTETFHLKQRLTTQNSGEGKDIPFTFPNDGTRNGTVPVTFAVPGDYIVEAFQDDNHSPQATSDKITVNSAQSITSTSSSTASTSSSSSEDTVSTTNLPEGQEPSDTSGDQTTASTDHITSSISIDTTLSSSSTGTGSSQSVSSSHSIVEHTKTSASSSNQPLSEPSVSASSNSTSDKPSSTSGSQPRILRIVGATVGGLVFLLLLLAALVYTLRRRSLRRKKYPTVFHRDRLVRNRSKASFSPLTPTQKDPETYTNSADVEEHASYSSRYKEDLAPSPPRQEGCLEYSLPAPLVHRAETPSPTLTYTDRQMEIYEVLVKKNTDLIRLKTELRRGGSVQQEIDGLKAVIGVLEGALASGWALGYTDEIPSEVSSALVPIET